jgi:hypothetical protein
MTAIHGPYQNCKYGVNVVSEHTNMSHVPLAELGSPPGTQGAKWPHDKCVCVFADDLKRCMDAYLLCYCACHPGKRKVTRQFVSKKSA